MVKLIRNDQAGTVSGLLISFILVVLLLVGAAGFGFWAYNSRQDYKNHTDSKVKIAVDSAKLNEDTVNAAKFAEAAKNPLKTYNGPEVYGSLAVAYPRTWGGYVDDTGQGNALVDGYFAPDVVPSITNPNSIFALRVQVLNATYAQTLQTFAGQLQSGKLTISAYALPKLPSVIGVEVVGQINPPASVTMVVLPLRSETLEISTQGSQFVNDFNTYILPNFSFSP